MDSTEARRAAYLNQQDAQDWQLQDFTEVEQGDTAIEGLAAKSKEPEPEADLPQPPTLEEIEAIQQQAWQEGFDQGKQQGFEQGIAEGRLKGAEQGLQQGLEQGRSQGIEAGQHEIVQRCGQLDALLNELIAPLQAVDEQVERELVTLAMKLAQAVVQVELTTSDAALLHALQTGIAALPQQRQQITVSANGDDKQLIEQSYGSDELAKRNWELQLEPSLAKGSLQIHTERSQVAVLGEDRLRKVLEQFASTPRAAVTEPEYPPAQPLQAAPAVAEANEPPAQDPQAQDPQAQDPQAQDRAAPDSAAPPSAEADAQAAQPLSPTSDNENPSQ
ncbi:FliH/SctL family protein [uncultured Ferrimonas sp.]|uniref:flagellar assembly protein FliH n=1 Tax=uncultured Ferrimonas sp. TaxID=432640 RepID=UPI00260390FE|nr:FliH/SctL family protein [uncultured Ferrimonas sp.]